VLVIVEENHSASEALRAMPHLAALAAAYGRTTAYRAITHPSLPNYLAIAGGSTFGVTDDAGPAAHPIAGASVFDAAIANGKPAKTYAESMPSRCSRASTDRYAVKHNPWAYFSSRASRTNCARYDVPAGTVTAGALHRDIQAGTLPTVGLLVPNICNDGHDCSLASADAWLHRWTAALTAGRDYRAGRLAIIVTFDEDDNSAGNTVLTVVVAPHTRGVAGSRAFTHYSMSRYLSEIAGVRPLRSAARAVSLRATFHL
jgi:acid phosphatase